MKTTVVPSSLLDLPEGSEPFDVIKIITKTKENIEKENEFWIRGLSENLK